MSDPADFQVVAQNPAGSSFPQQGQLNWVSLGNTVYSMTAAVLQRFSQYHVQPATYASGRALACQYKISQLAEKRMLNAIESLSGIPGFDSVLYFGFGYRSFPKLLADNPKGLELLALCSCLSEVHSHTVTAWILEDLWAIQGFPEEYKPPQPQFAALAKACSGVLSRTSFGLTVAAMHHGVYENPNKWETMASPSIDIARALDGLFKISRGEIESMRIVGSIECAFIAGLAQWLFDLTVHVENEEGRLVYSNTPEHSTAQLQVTYMGTVQIAKERGLRLLHATYILRSHNDMLVHTPDKDLLGLTLRAPLDSCLSHSMGVLPFRRFLDHSHSTGSLLGTIIRLVELIAWGDIKLDDWKAKSELP